MNKPAFIIAGYQQPVPNFDRWKARGCNAMVGPEIGNPPAITGKKWCEELATRGMFVIGNKTLLKDQFRPPNLIAWILDDEPNETNHNTHPAVVAAQAAAFRKLDPTVPIFLNLGGDKLTSAGPNDTVLNKSYVASADVVFADWYPINREFARYPIDFKGRELDYLKSIGAKAVGSVIESSWQKLNKASPKGRAPTALELRKEVETALSHSAKHLIYFSTREYVEPHTGDGWPQNYDPTPQDVSDEMTKVNAEINAKFNAGAAPGPVQPIPTPAPVPSGTPQIVLILGNYKSIAAHKALADAILKVWKPVLGNTPIFVTKWDNDVAKEIAATYPTGPLRIVGFSFGGSKATDVCRELSPRPIDKLILIDPVPRPPNVPHGPSQFPGFEVPANVKSAWCGYRLPSEQKTLFSSPIRTGGEFTNYHYVPEPGKSEEEQHGQLIWNGVAVKQVMAK